MVILYGKKRNVQADLPGRWKVLHRIFKGAKKETGSVEAKVAKALDYPIGSVSLESRLGKGQRVAIVVDDLTRPTPIAVMLPEVLNRVHRAGARVQEVDIVIALGTHRPMTEDEIRARLGDRIATAYRISNHDAWAKDLVTVGELPGYGSIRINKTVAEAETRVTLGSILPHLHNGFSGGPKTVMPGISAAETVLHHHLKNVTDSRSILGNTTRNPWHDDLRAIAALTRIDFGLYALFDGLGNPYAMLAGNHDAVYEAGMQRVREDLGFPVSAKSDITIVSSYPYDDGPQVVKPIVPAALVTKPGGTIILCAEVAHPMPGQFLDNVAKVRGDGGDEAEARIRARLSKRESLIEGGGSFGVDFNLALLLIFFAARRFRVIFVADQQHRAASEQMGFDFMPDLAKAIAEEAARRPESTVNVIPAGGYIFPLIDEPMRLF
jgi:nickel-dependent lactate racemase